MKGGLSDNYKMKDLGLAKYLLGVEIRRRSRGGYFIVQEKYAREVVEKFGMGRLGWPRPLLSMLWIWGWLGLGWKVTQLWLASLTEVWWGVLCTWLCAHDQIWQWLFQL